MIGLISVKHGPSSQTILIWPDPYESAANSNCGQPDFRTVLLFKMWSKLSVLEHIKKPFHVERAVFDT